MTSWASAPGKIMLAGEYAVLEGGPAILMAIDRRATARWVDDPPPPSPLLVAIATELERRGIDSDPLRRLAVDSEPLRGAGGVKLGLGSSAAAAVAATALALGQGAAMDQGWRQKPQAGGASPRDTIDQGWRQKPQAGSASPRSAIDQGWRQKPQAGSASPRDTIDQIHAVAHRAHRAAQGLRGHPGSGADVATSVHGGLLEVRCAPDPEQLPAVNRLALPPNLVLIPVWTGTAADTAALVEQVRGAADSSAHRRALASIATAADELARACRRADASAAIAALGKGARAVAALGDAAGVSLVSPTHHRVARLAEKAGGVAKPTGAGAGDIALAAFADAACAARFCDDIEATGMHPLGLRVDESGVDFG